MKKLEPQTAIRLIGRIWTGYGTVLLLLSIWGIFMSMIFIQIMSKASSNTQIGIVNNSYFWFYNNILPVSILLFCFGAIFIITALSFQKRLDWARNALEVEAWISLALFILFEILCVLFIIKPSMTNTGADSIGKIMMMMFSILNLFFILGLVVLIRIIRNKEIKDMMFDSKKKKKLEKYLFKN